MAADIIPKIKKKITSFIKEEKGTISKQSMVSMGAFIGALVASGLLSAKDAEAGSITIASANDGVNAAVTATHSHHASHANHASHASHASHSSHSSSDIRLKKNLHEVSHPVEKLMKLNGVRFQWRDNDMPDMGVIAQEVERVFPEIVLTDEKTGLKSVNYNALIAPLLEAVKEQQKQIGALKKEIEILKAEKLA